MASLSRPRSDSLLGADDLDRLGDPLDFIYADHLREREVCALIDRIAAGDLPGAATLELLVAFLEQQLPLHLQDEEQDLFPLMRERCEPDDEIDAVIDRLESDHGHAGNDTGVVLAILKRTAPADRTALSADDRAVLADYATHSRRHLIVENAIILPIARGRLLPEDLAAMLRNMLARRGLDRVMESADAR